MAKKKESKNEPSQLEIWVNPEKYGYEQCTHCNGYGSSLKESNPKCSKCKGTGLQKKKG